MPGARERGEPKKTRTVLPVKAVDGRDASENVEILKRELVERGELLGQSVGKVFKLGLLLFALAPTLDAIKINSLSVGLGDGDSLV